MNWDRYFTAEMNHQYARLAVEAAKAAALRGSVRDVAFLYETRAWFVRSGGGEATATAFTTRASAELIDERWMNIATWGTGGTVVPVEFTVEDLFKVVSEIENTGPTYFFVPTEKGREWVTRHDKLLHELHAR